MSASIFLSHAGEDTAAAKELAHHLRQAGVEVWLDVERLKAGVRWIQSLATADDRRGGKALRRGRREPKNKKALPVNWVAGMDLHQKKREFRLELRFPLRKAMLLRPQRLQPRSGVVCAWCRRIGVVDGGQWSVIDEDGLVRVKSCSESTSESR